MRLWLSCEAFTVEVEVDEEGYIKFAPPIVRRFIGQHIDNLLSWMEKKGGLIIRPLR